MNCAKFTSQAKTKVGVMSRGLGAPDAAVGSVDGDVGNTSHRAGTKERALPYSPPRGFACPVHANGARGPFGDPSRAVRTPCEGRKTWVISWRLLGHHPGLGVNCLALLFSSIQ